MIAIKGMEMPKNCNECPYSCDYCALTGEWVSDTEQIRDKNCPLVEIDEQKVEKLEKIEQIVNAREYIENGITYSYCYNQGRKVKEIKEVLEQE